MKKYFYNRQKLTYFLEKVKQPNHALFSSGFCVETLNRAKEIKQLSAEPQN